METGEPEVSEVEAGAAENATDPEASASNGESKSASQQDGDAAAKLEARLAKITGGKGASESDDPRGDASAREVSAATIGRMLGLATASQLRLMEGKIDLLSTRVNNMTVRMEKVISILGGVPTGGDLERIDMQIGSLRIMLREAFQGKEGSDGTTKETPGPGERGDKAITSAKIVTNADE